MSPFKWALRRALATHDDLYDASYYVNRRNGARQSADVIGQTIAQTFGVATVQDVGCATGDLLEVLRELRVEASGLEYSSAAIEICRSAGLKVRQFDLERDEAGDDVSADVMVSTEVAEHLPQSCADRYVDLLCRARRAVIFTAAPPGQGGTDHVNEQPREYWIEKFAARGFVFDSETTRQWSDHWSSRSVLDHYHRNLMIFRAPHSFSNPPPIYRRAEGNVISDSSR